MAISSRPSPGSSWGRTLRTQVSTGLRFGVSAALMFALLPFGAAPAFAAVPRYGVSAVFPSQAQSFSAPSSLSTDASGTVWVLDRDAAQVIHLDSAGNLLARWGHKGTAVGEMDPGGDGGGLTISSDGLLYIADTGNNRVEVFTPAGVLVRTFGALGNGPGQLLAPMGVALDAEGRAYVSDAGNHRVEVYSPQGSWLATWTFDGLVVPRGITVGNQGGTEYVYVADTAAGRVIKSDLSGVDVKVGGVDIGLTDWGWGAVTTRFFQLSGCRVDSAGNLWLTDRAGKPAGTTAAIGETVERCDLDGHVIVRYGTAGSAASGTNHFATPLDVALSSDGDTFYVADRDNARIVRMSLTSGWLDTWNSSAPPTPRGVAVDALGRYWVADAAAGDVRVFSAAGSQVASYGDGTFSQPTGVAIDASGTAWVSDSGASKVWKLGSDGSVLGAIGAGTLASPGGVGVDASQTVFVADTGNNRVARFDSAGTLVDSIGDGDLSAPSGVAVSRTGTVFVADTDDDCVKEFTKSGVALGTIGGLGTDPGQMDHPLGVAVAASGEIFVADTGNDRVQRFETGGGLGTYFGTRGTAPGQLLSPSGTAVTPDGHVVVAEKDGLRVSVFAPDSAAPVTTAAVTPSWWTSGTVSVTLSASDPLGVQATYYSLNGGPATVYYGPLSIGSAGVTAISYWSADRAGNVESAHAASAYVDRTPPDITIHGVTPGGLYGTGAHGTAPWASSSDTTTAFSATLNGLPHTLGTPVSVEGSCSLDVVGTDAAGNTASSSVAFSTDFTPPVTLTSAPTHPVNHSVVVTMTASDAVAGVAETYYSLDGGAQHSYSLPVPVSGLGQHTLVYFSADNVGNNEALHTVDIVIDQTPPDVAVSGVADGGCYNTTVWPDAQSSDLSAAFVATLNGQPFALGSAVTTAGAYALVVRATDPAGNSATATANFTIDRTPPAGTFSINGGATYVNKTAVSLDSSVTGASEVQIDSGSGFFGALIPYADHIPITLLPGDGAKTVRVRYLDAAGNVLALSTVVRIDTSPPPLTVLGVADGGLYKAAVWPNAESTDSFATLSGTLDGAAYPLATPYAVQGPHVFVAQAKDRAGNVTTQAVSFAMDFTLPVVTSLTSLTHPQYITMPYGAPLLSWTATDAVNVDGYSYCVDQNAAGVPDASMDTTASSVRLSSLPGGSWYFHVRAYDHAGNWGPASTYLLSFTTPVKLSPPRTAHVSGRTWRVSGTVYPTHSSGIYLVAERSQSGAWVRVKTLAVHLSAVPGGSSRYTTTVSLGSGTWRLRAYHPFDTHHPATFSAASAPIVVP